MSDNKSELELLITKLCPKGVQYKELGEVFNIKNGYTPSKAKPEYWTNGTIPWFRMEDIRKNGRILSDSIQHISREAVKGGRLFPANSIIMATTATIGEHALLTVDSIANQQFSYLTKKEEYSEMLDMKFFFYYCYVLADWCKKNTNSASFPIVQMGKFKKFKIPIPPLVIQSEIVEILNSYTDLESELENELNSELKARKNLYEYYRERLLTFPEDGVQWATLREIGTMIRGSGLQKKDLSESGVECIHYGQIYTYYGTFADKTKSFVSVELAKKLKKAKKGDVLIAGVSENIEDVCKPLGWLGDEICISGDMFAFRHNQNTKFITYLMQTLRFRKHKERYAQGTKVIRVNVNKILDFKIPIPSMQEQERIVSLLDKFDTYTNDILTDLSAELNSRRSQYKYYRNKLLTFLEV
jgi:type I restriction enzyme, S subunit